MPPEKPKKEWKVKISVASGGNTRRQGLDKPEEECGVFGIYAPGEDVARLTYFALYTLQHRGQESAGIATGDGYQIYCHKKMGLVSQVFDEEDLARLSGFVAIGHTRYSTMGASRILNAQPVIVESNLGPLALAHNGNLVNIPALREDLEERGIECAATTDSEIIALMIANAQGENWLEKIRNTMPRLEGAYTLVLATTDQLMGIRDSLGIRPFCLGKLDSGWVLASESCAFNTIGAQFLREVDPGEVVIVDQNGLETYTGQESLRRALCIFEFIYFARPDSMLNGRSLYQARLEMGRQLAREHPAPADIVIPVPDSATPAAIGYAEESGLPFSEGLIKSRYIGRTFISPTQRIRESGVKLKFNPLPEVLGGKSVVVVDDSIVRGSTTRPLVALLRRAGAREIHMRIHSPPMIYPCFLGVDTARQEELIAARLAVPEIGEHIEADTLGYLSLEGLIRAIGLPQDKFCDACFTGDYPLSVQLAIDKFVLETREKADG